MTTKFETFADITEENLAEAKPIVLAMLGQGLNVFATVMHEGKECVVLSTTKITSDDLEQPLDLSEDAVAALEPINDSLANRIANLANVNVDYNVPTRVASQALRTLMMIFDIVPTNDPEHDKEYLDMYFEGVKNHKHGLMYMMQAQGGNPLAALVGAVREAQGSSEESSEAPTIH